MTPFPFRSITPGILLFLLFLSAASLVLGGCVGTRAPARKIDFYTLDYPAPDLSSLPATGAVLRIDRFSAEPAFTVSRMVYQETPFRQETYPYHRWFSPPTDLVTAFLARDAGMSGRFRAVSTFDSRFPATHVLTGSVNTFMEQDVTEHWTAELSLTVTLMKEGEPDVSRRILFQKRYAASEPLTQKNPLGLAQGMSRAMARISGEILADAIRALAAPPAS